MKQMYTEGLVRLLVVSQGFCWEVTDLKSHIVVIMDVERYDGTEKRFVDYAIPDVLQMQGLACLTLKNRQGSSLAPKFLLMCYTPRKEYFVKFIQEPLPVESSLGENLHDPLNAEIVAGTITSK